MNACHPYPVVSGQRLYYLPISLVFLKPALKQYSLNSVLFADHTVSALSVVLNSRLEALDLILIELVLLLQVLDHVVVEHVPACVLKVDVFHDLVQFLKGVHLGVELDIVRVLGEEVGACTNYKRRVINYVQNIQ